MLMFELPLPFENHMNWYDGTSLLTISLCNATSVDIVHVSK